MHGFIRFIKSSRLLTVGAHTVRIEREGGSPDLRPMLDLCRKTHKQ